MSYFLDLFFYFCIGALGALFVLALVAGAFALAIVSRHRAVTITAVTIADQDDDYPSDPE